MRLSPDIRGTFRKLVEKGLTVTRTVIPVRYCKADFWLQPLLLNKALQLLNKEASIDDYSRFLVAAEQFNREPKTKEETALLEKRNRLAEGNTV